MAKGYLSAFHPISMPYETFKLRFEECEHVLNVPLMDSSHRGATCYVCQPEMRDVPAKGKCPKCVSEAEFAELRASRRCVAQIGSKS